MSDFSEVAPLLFFLGEPPPFSFLDERKGGKRKSRRQGRQPSLPGTHHNSSRRQGRLPSLPGTHHNSSRRQGRLPSLPGTHHNSSRRQGRLPSLPGTHHNSSRRQGRRPSLPGTHHNSSRRQGRQPSLPGTHHHNSSTTQQTNNSTPTSDGDLDRETADVSDDAFVVSVAGGAWAAEDCVTVAP